MIDCNQIMKRQVKIKTSLLLSKKDPTETPLGKFYF